MIQGLGTERASETRVEVKLTLLMAPNRSVAASTSCLRGIQAAPVGWLRRGQPALAASGSKIMAGVRI